MEIDLTHLFNSFQKYLIDKKDDPVYNFSQYNNAVNAYLFGVEMKLPIQEQFANVDELNELKSMAMRKDLFEKMNAGDIGPRKNRYTKHKI